MFGYNRDADGRGGDRGECGRWGLRFARDERPGPEGHHRFGRHWGGHHHGRGGERFSGDGPGRRGRVFDQGELRLVLLALIAEAPRHGYEIIKAIEDRLAGSYSPSPGVIYPTLTLLNEMGFATVSETDGGRKLYTITEEGRADLAANRPAVDAVFARMDRASASRAGERSPQVVRAIENMKTALRLRLSRGPLNEAEADAIAAALDTAARGIDKA